MLPTKRTPTTRPHRPNVVYVFRVEPIAPYGWFVYLDGFPKTHFFAMKDLALIYARARAKATLPSVVLSVAADGKVEVHRTYTEPRAEEAHRDQRCAAGAPSRLVLPAALRAAHEVQQRVQQREHAGRQGGAPARPLARHTARPV